MKAVMYHYVREYNSSFPNFRFLDVKNFTKQLDYFEENFGFVSKQDWENVFSNGSLTKETISRGVVLTFDDAMSCHYDHVYKILKSRGLWGIFYIPTRPYLLGKMLDVHRIHLLCGKFDGIELLKVCKGLVDETMMPFRKWKEFKNQTYKYQNNDAGVSDFKRIINYFVDEKIKEALLDEICKVLGFNDFDTSFYLSTDQLKLMSAEGMIIGSHTNNHPVMSKLDKASQELEIVASFDLLEATCCLPHRTYCHPFGGFHSFNKDTISLLEENNVTYSFNVESRDIDLIDILEKPNFLPRFDCNVFPFGQVS